MVSAEGGATLRIFESPGGIQAPRWSPDGASLQYFLTQNGTTNLREQPLTAQAPRKLKTLTSAQVFDFNWSHDCVHVLMAHGTRNSDVVLIQGLH